jgi:uncharacterized membrane protein (DUF4010 family)
MRWGRGTEIGFVGRLGVSLLALYLLGGLWSDDVLGLALGVVGAALLAAATGVVEVAMALSYRRSRRPVPE